MTTSLLTSELISLIQETKRKNQDLKTAAERSLNELKSLANATETQVAADLKCRPDFVTPFLLACRSRNPKFAGSGVLCLQRLILARGLSNDSLEETLDAFRECSSSVLDIQLKVLQALPSLLQNYVARLKGRLLVSTFEVCFLLYGSKTAVVSNTAAATLQQLVASTFDKVVTEDSSSPDTGSFIDIQVGESKFSLRESAWDAYHIWNDICRLTEGKKPTFLLAATLSQNFGLELIESILSVHVKTISNHAELLHLCRSSLIPFVMRLLSERAPFPTTVRAMRLVPLFLDRLLFALASECELMLTLLNHILDPENAVMWKRALCLELFRSICSDSALIRRLFYHFDEKNEKRNIVGEQLAVLVRLASEKPAIIGLGQKSTSSSHSRQNSVEQTTIQVDSLMGSGGGAVTVAESDPPGISTRWSTLRVPCIEQLDKSEAPALPATYIYSLVLTCITTFSEGLAKFLLPFTLPIEAKGKQESRLTEEDEQNDGLGHKNKRTTNSENQKLSRTQSTRNRKSLVNPLSLREHELYSQIRTSSKMVDHCWPALLATYSTFLNATLDSENYHVLIRSFQRFTQVAGLLDLSTPRDAFLTTLGKFSVPSTSFNTLGTGLSKPLSSVGGSENLLQTVNQTEREHDASSPSKTSFGRQWQTNDPSYVSMSTRNLLCLRALINLGIALGPLLQTSWRIILETLQHADSILSYSETARRTASGHVKQTSGGTLASDDKSDAGEFSLEVAAAYTAATRMFESTRDLPDQAFMDILRCLFTLCRKLQLHSTELLEDVDEDLVSPQSAVRNSSKLPSHAYVSNDGALAVQGFLFVLSRLGEIIHCNIPRLQKRETTESGWDIVTEMLTSSLSFKDFSTSIRVEAANNLKSLVLDISTSQDRHSEDERDEIRRRALLVILKGVSLLHQEDRSNTKTSQSCDIEIHRQLLETLRLILERCGDSLGLGWDSVFAIITSVFTKPISGDHVARDDEDNGFNTRSPKLLQSAFGPLQLICSDFLSSVPRSCLLILLDTLYAFCRQEQDLNISLTTITFFRNVSDFLVLESFNLKFDLSITQSRSEDDLIRVISGEDRSSSMTALWLCLLLRLMKLANDEKMEVRHSVLHTIFRIFDASGNQLNPAAWQMCYRIIIFEMLHANELHYEANQPTNTSQGDHVTLDRWTETAIIMVGGVSKLFTQTFAVMTAGGHFAETWSHLLKVLQALLDRGALDLSTAICQAITQILIRIEDFERIGKPSLALTWNIWKDSNPVSGLDASLRNKDNQDCLIAYLEWLNQIYRLMGSGMLLEQVKDVVTCLRSVVIGSEGNVYRADLDTMTKVQKYVLDSLTKMPAESLEAFPEIIKSLVGFMCLAYESKSMKKSQTFVALSKSAMDLLLSGMSDFLRRGQSLNPDLVTQAIAALSVPIKLKYKWRLEGKEPKTWKKATMTALSILELCIPRLERLGDNAAFWDAVIEVGEGVVAADCESCINRSDIPQDQNFDIEAYSRLRQFLTPGIGSNNIPNSIRLKYANLLFQHSIIHTPHPDDLALPGQDLLQGLQSIHIGRTQSLPPHPRSKLCYVLLDEIFHLVGIDEKSVDRLKFAQTVGPFLILRAGITLKAYMYDQPLRGRMPQPRSQKQELLLVLQRLQELKAEPRAIPDSSGIISEHKKHLHILYPLMIQAMDAAWRDEEVSMALRRILATVGQDFGLALGKVAD